MRELAVIESVGYADFSFSELPLESQMARFLFVWHAEASDMAQVSPSLHLCAMSL